MSEKAHILYVEDDEALSFVTRDNLELEGYRVTACSDGDEALRYINEHKGAFDLAILDVMLPQVDGYTLAQEIRKYDTEVPIMFVSAKSLKEDRIHGLRIGADDYITKPFSIEELLLKTEMFLRRSSKINSKKPDIHQIGHYVFDYPNLLLTLNEHKESLTQKEGDLLYMFVCNKGNIVKRSDILEKIWGKNDYFLGRSLDVFVSRLRRFLKEDPRLQIENIHGVGFRLVEKTE